MSLRTTLKNIYFFLIFIFVIPLSPQNFQQELTSIPFFDSFTKINIVFSGGFNNIEHQFIDIDGDDDYDLFFLNSDASSGWLKNEGTKFLPSFNLPDDSIPGLTFREWFYFVDIDSDNDFDFFTTSSSGFIEYHQNIGSSSDPVFVIREDTVKDVNGDPVYSEFGSNPVFVDADNDGDYNFITGNSIGTLSFFRNVGSNDNFSFQFITNFWENISIVGGGIKKVMHGASSIEFNDIDGDNDLDIFWGDYFSRSLYFIRNNGTAFEPAMDTTFTYEFFPPDKDTILTSGFNMPRLIDIDGDEDSDLFVSVLFDPSVPQSLMFYENQGNNTSPDFKFVTSDYLKTLDAGIESVPFLIDIDNDGDKDLFLGSARNPDGSILFFQNNGTASSPSFILIDSTFEDISYELSLAPAFGDIDGDKDFDLLVGTFSGTIALYRNTGTKILSSFEFDGFLQTNDNTAVDIGLYARPFLFDADNDNDLDLAVGRFNGEISFYRNIGNNIQYSFMEENEYFDIDFGNNSSIFLFDYDNDGDNDLFAGNKNGYISFYENNGNNLSPDWTLKDSTFLDKFFGSEPVPFFTDIDNDTDPDIFIGNYKGGLYFFRNQTIVNVKENNILIPSDFSLKAFPNPFNPETNIEVVLQSEENISIKVYNFLGEEVINIFEGSLNEGKHNFTWDGKNNFNRRISSGIYIISAAGKNHIKNVKILFLK